MYNYLFLGITLLIPNLILFYHSPLAQLGSLVVTLFSIWFLCLLIQSSRRLFWLLPLMWLMPFAAYYAVHYDRWVDVFFISVLGDTNLSEIQSYFGDKLIYIALGWLVWVAVTTYVLVFKRNFNVFELRYFKYQGIVAVMILITAFTVLCNRYNMVEASQDFAKSYPSGVVIQSADFVKQMQKMQGLKDQLKNFKFGAKQTVELDDKQIVVLVIGETGRADHWQLNHYARETTPLLSKEKNLVNLSNMLSLAPATIVSVPMMLTRKPENQMYQYDFNEPSVIQAFKESGFKTYWISTQQQMGVFDSLTSTYAQEADYVDFFNFTQSVRDRDMDNVLLPALKAILAKPEQKQFIVIHTLGSHQQYDKRYPAQFNIFRPSTSDLKAYDPQNKTYKQQIINSYDNSVLFTDYVLSSFIDQLKQQNAVSFLMYAADHGEDLFDGDCAKSGHGNSTIYDFHVPSVVWVSDQYKKDFSDKYQQLQKNAASKVNHTSIFPTLIDSVGIQIPHYAMSRSILADLKPYPRLVLSKQIDFDKTQPMGQCKVLDLNHR